MDNSIRSISENYLCSACGACYVVCSKEAISFDYTSVGRKFAKVNNDLCVNCGLCRKVCPSIDRLELHKKYNDPFIGTVISTYSGHSTNEIIYKNSQSGGACSEILSYLFDTGKIDGAIVCRMSYGKTPIVEGILVENKEDLLQCQKSCYTPVDVLSALKNAHNKSSLALVGLPCHIQGACHLEAITKLCSNIKYKIGLICDRTLCQGIQDVMCSYLQSNEKVKIDWRRKDFVNKGKYYSYKEAPVVVYGKNSSPFIVPNIYRFTLKDIFTAPRCRVCYDKLNTFCDITLGDPWGMSDIDWNHGESLIITRTLSGQRIIDEMQRNNRMVLTKRSYNEVIKGQLIEERRLQVAHYSNALNVMGYDSNSYLYNLGTEITDSAKEILEFQDFKERESLSLEEIIKYGRICIKRAIFRKSLLGRIYTKVKKILRIN